MPQVQDAVGISLRRRRAIPELLSVRSKDSYRSLGLDHPAWGNSRLLLIRADLAGLLLFKCVPNLLFVAALHLVGLLFGGPEQVAQKVRRLLKGVRFAGCGVQGFCSHLRGFMRVLFGRLLLHVSEPVARWY